MRPVICALLSVATLACSAFAAAKVTVVLQFEARHSEPSINEMKRELQSQLQSSGVELNWRQMDELSASDSFPSLVVVKFHGSCEATALSAPLPSEPVSLAYTHVSNGSVIPFADVECDRIRSALAALRNGYSSRNDLLFGRAIGRVLAHELHHIIGRTQAHTQHGLSRKCLSPQELIADRT
jgi:hypothetical protein